LGDLALDINTGWNIMEVTTAGTSGASEPPAFLTTPLAGTITEGPNTLVWTNLAPTAKAAYTFPGPNWVIKDAARNWIMLITPGTNNASGVIANYDPLHPAGLLAPRLDRAWEIGGGDQAFIFELT
jgi:hypothetical protein